MINFSQIKNGIQASKGRLRLELTVQWLGEDLLALLTGGKTHIGASALWANSGENGILELENHREGELALRTARILSRALQCKVAVICGIHYNNILPAEIAAIENMAPQMARRLAEELSDKDRIGEAGPYTRKPTAALDSFTGIIAEQSNSKGSKSMIKLEELEKLQSYLESRQIEDDFRFGSEQERIEMLETLEKLMDIGEKADEVATRLIFKGKLPGIPETH